MEGMEGATKKRKNSAVGGENVKWWEPIAKPPLGYLP